MKKTKLVNYYSFDGILLFNKVEKIEEKKENKNKKSEEKPKKEIISKYFLG